MRDARVCGVTLVCVLEGMWMGSLFVVGGHIIFGIFSSHSFLLAISGSLCPPELWKRNA